jgi:1,4-dihydroxy-2-naphthoate octaprenyltransferase
VFEEGGEMTSTDNKEFTRGRDGDELAHQPRLALLALGSGLLAPMALFSSTWVGLGLGVLAVFAGAAAWPQVRRGQVSISPLVAGLVFGVLAIALVWVGPGVHQVIWG